KKFEDNLELKKLEIMRKKQINPDKRVRSQSSRWDASKKIASRIFHLLVKASYDKAIDEEERNRAKKICEKILSPFSVLSGFLADYDAGTLKHDIAKLLLSKSPKDFGYIRENWSVRLLSRVCTLDLKTKSASKSQVGRLIKDIKWNCSPKRKLHSPDQEYGSILKRIAKTMNTMGAEDMILFGDEFKYTSSKINRRLEPKYLPNGLQDIFPQGNLRIESSRSYKPSTSIQITGLYNPITKKLGINEIMKANFDNFYSGLLSLLDYFCKIKTGKIYLILDNAPYHGKNDLQEKLNHKYGNRFEIIWLPVYSPNNNPIEKIWDVLLSAVDRECNNEIDLRKSLKLSIEDYSNNKSESKGYHNLTCFVCDKKWEFKPENRVKNRDSIEKHLCFTIPDLNPFAIHSLTHSQEEFYLGQYV
ncbi:MAG: transposase, partial [Candidatus Heimdallarchaeota archaeon]